MSDEKIIKKDENGKPIVGSYEYGTVDSREEAFNGFKTAALATFEEELEALTNGLVNEDEINVEFHLVVRNASGDDKYERQTMTRHCDREISLYNPKILKPVKEESQNGTEL